MYGGIPSYKKLVPYPGLLMVATDWLKGCRSLQYTCSNYFIDWNLPGFMDKVMLVLQKIDTDPSHEMPIDFSRHAAPFAKRGYPGCVGVLGVRSFRVAAEMFHLIIIRNTANEQDVGRVRS